MRIASFVIFGVVLFCVLWIEAGDKNRHSGTSDELMAAAQQLEEVAISTREAQPALWEFIRSAYESLARLSRTMESTEFKPAPGEAFSASFIDEFADITYSLEIAAEHASKSQETAIENERLISSVLDRIDASKVTLQQLDIETSSGISPYWFSAKDFLAWLRPIGLFAFFGFVVLIALLCNPKFRTWFATNMRKIDINLFGIQLSIDNLDEDRLRVEDIYKRVMLRVTKQYRIAISNSDLSLAADSVMIRVDKLLQNKEYYKRGLGEIKSISETTYRYCLFVPSYLDGDLIQASEYGGTANSVKNKIGRRFSIRYGIVGRAFRQRRMICNPNVSSDPDKLVEEWGLTYTEALRQSSHRAGRGGQVTDDSALIAIPINENGGEGKGEADNDPIGVLFIDIRKSKEYEQLTQLDRKALYNAIRESSEHQQLINSLTNLRNQIDFDDKALDQPEGA